MGIVGRITKSEDHASIAMRGFDVRLSLLSLANSTVPLLLRLQSSQLLLRTGVISGQVRN